MHRHLFLGICEVGGNLSPELGQLLTIYFDLDGELLKVVTKLRAALVEGQP